MITHVLQRGHVHNIMESLSFLSVDVKEHILLMPSYIGNIEKGIFEHLNKRILQYSTDLGGVMIAYSKPSILQEAGLIEGDYPQIHFDLHYSACVLQTPFGSTITATVTRIGDDYFTCTVQGCISIFIPPGSTGNEEWLSEGKDVLISIVKLSVLHDEYVLIGKLEETNSPLSVDVSTKKGSNKKKHKKNKSEIDHCESDSTVKASKKRKRQKYHSINTEESIQHSIRKHEKRKREDLEQDGPSLKKNNVQYNDNF